MSSPLPEPELVAQLAPSLVDTAGGFLRNTLRSSPLTCTTCDGTVRTGWSTCYKCGHIYNDSPLAADQVASMIYAVSQRQSGYMMRGYKGSPRVQEHVRIVGSLLWIGISHRGCAAKLAHAPVTHWASVPSLPAKSGSHVLRQLIERNPYLTLPQLEVKPAQRLLASPREFEPANFTVPSFVPHGTHVLLMEDTWVGGGHVQSTAAALKLAGAAKVSILNVARWLEADDEATAAFIPEHFDRREYSPDRCPWTGRSCP